MTRHSADAALTVALGIVLSSLLLIQDELPAPKTPLPPPVIAEVEGASIGVETAPAGTFWTIDRSQASIVIANTTDQAVSVTLSARVFDGPCAEGRRITMDGDTSPRIIVVDPGQDAVIEATNIALSPFGRAEITLTSGDKRCGPLPNDPRSIAFQVFDLIVSVES
jgi:hypothetical protein